VGRKVGEHLDDDEFGYGVEDVFRYGYINTAGKLVWPMEFADAKPVNSFARSRETLAALRVRIGCARDRR
jgi:hypothetical protein